MLPGPAGSKAGVPSLYLVDEIVQHTVVDRIAVKVDGGDRHPGFFRSVKELGFRNLVREAFVPASSIRSSKRSASRRSCEEVTAEVQRPQRVISI
jgi:hypothetical protein